MEIIIPIIAVIAFLGFLGTRLNKKVAEDCCEEDNNYFRDEAVASIYEQAHKSAEETNRKIDGDMKQEEKPDTIGLMLDTLNALGCQPTINDDGTLSVSYQGENFRMEFGGMFARVWDPMWAGVKADDPDMPKIREAVNKANFNFGPTVVLSDPDEKGVIGFHSRRDIMLHPECPDNVPFVKSVLDSFFDAKESVRTCYHEIDVRQNEENKNRRPVGFATDKL